MSFWSNLKKKRQIKHLLKEYERYIGRDDEVAMVQSEYFAILLDDLEVWKHTDKIPSQSRYVPLVTKNPKNKISRAIYGQMQLNAKRKGRYDMVATVPGPISECSVPCWKDRTTGLKIVQES